MMRFVSALSLALADVGSLYAKSDVRSCRTRQVSTARKSNAGKRAGVA